MGFYLEAPDRFNKAQYLKDEYGALEVSQMHARWVITIGVDAVICVVSNPEFEAAAFCYKPEEFKRFTQPHDVRPKTWLVIPDRKRVEDASGYTAALLEEELM
jgi:hypothetical protein